MPVEARRAGVVLVDVPERAVVAGIDPHRTVVAPPIVAELRTQTFPEARLRLHRAGRIGWRPASVANRRKPERTGHAVSKSHVPRLIHRNAAPPPVIAAAGGEGALLKQRERSAGRD